MLRREFLTAALGVTVPVTTVAASAAVETQISELRKFKRVFRHDGKGWKEIAWEEMKAGDKVILVDDYDGYLSVEALQITKSPEPLSEDNDVVWVDYKNNLLPRIWGVPREVAEKVMLSEGKS